MTRRPGRRPNRRDPSATTQIQTVQVATRYEVSVRSLPGAWAAVRGRWEAEVIYVSDHGEGRSARHVLGRARARSYPQAVRAGRLLAVDLEHGVSTAAGTVTNLGPITVVIVGRPAPTWPSRCGGTTTTRRAGRIGSRRHGRR
jgi:hypothetical protein